MLEGVCDIRLYANFRFLYDTDARFGNSCRKGAGFRELTEKSHGFRHLFHIRLKQD